LAGATFTIQNDNSWGDVEGNSSLSNQGVLTKAAGSGTTTINVVLDNPGTINVDSGTLTFASRINQFFNQTLTAGTWNVSAGADLNINGTITTNAAVVSLGGAGARFDAINTLAFNSGSFSFGGGLSLSTAGDLVNSGGLTVGAGSTLTVNGNFTQTSSGALNVLVGSPAAGNQFSHIVSVSGSASLAGTLNISLTNGFGPAAGEQYPILVFNAVTGTFTTVNGVTFERFTLFRVSYTTTSVVLVALISAPNLATSAITVPVPPTGSDGQNIAINYTVQNLGDATAIGEWFDSVYLTASGVFDGSAVLIGRVDHHGDVAGHTSYSETLTAPVPGVVPGDYYIAVVADSRGLIPDVNRLNNILVSSQTVHISVPVLALGATATGTIAKGQDIYYQVTLPAGHDVQVTANFGAVDAAELYVSYQKVPNTAAYDDYAYALNQTQQQLLLAATQGGTYYILLHGKEGAATGTSFSLTTTDLPFGVRGLSPNTGGNIGFTTVTVTGTQMSPATVVSLVASNGTVYPAFSTVFQNTDTVFATFDLTGLATGTYGLRIDDQGRTATDAGAFTVTAGGGGNVVYNMSAPNFVRDGTIGTVTVTYENIGTSDALAPLLTLVANNAVLRLPDQTDYAGSSVQFLAIDSSGPGGILRPGVIAHLTFSFKASSSAPPGSQISFLLGLTAPNMTIDWASVKDQFRPAYIVASAWDAIWGNFLAAVGTTTDSLQTALDRDATYLSQLGEYRDDVASLLSFEIEKANDFLPVAPSVGSVDASSPAPGLSLVFSRQFATGVSGHYQLGRLGHGWTDNWDISASTDAQGNVTIRQGGALRSFTRQADGTYAGAGGDGGVLTNTGGVYHLVELNGLVTVFRADGSLDYVQDTNGNRITAGYTSGQLTTLSASNGEQMTLSYNGQGLVSQVTDAQGRVATYQYDVGMHLLSCTTMQGVTQYTYVTGQSPATEYALASVANPDGTHLFLHYDNAGRLIGENRDNGAEAVAFVYGAGAGVTATDALGNSTVTVFNEFARPGLVIDPLGRSTRYQYDSNQNLVQLIAPGGLATSYTVDGSGNVIRAIDPLGRETDFTYAAQFNRLLSSTDPNGNKTSYSYGATGNLMTVTYANGAQQNFTYDPLGNLSETINGRGDAIHNSYNALGQITRRDFADGTHLTYAYDAHGNLTAATDAAGTTTLQYNGADQLTKITYPNSRYLQFTYDAGGRRMQSVDQSGFTVNYQYDAVGRLAGLTDGSGATIVLYSYDAVGRLSRKDLGNKTYTTYDYDRAGELMHIINHAPGGSINSSFAYTYDNAGHPATVTTLDGVWTLTHDADGELTHAVFASNQPAQIPNQDVQYTYDANGNRVSMTSNGVVTPYTVNNVNQYTAVGATSYTYDADGNLIRATDGSGTTNYTFNDLNQLTGISGPSVSAAFTYDPFGRAATQTVNGTFTSFLTDPAQLGNVVASYDATGALIGHNTYGLGLTSQVSASGSASYYDFDSAGNTIGITGATGAYVNQYRYLPFGETTPVSALLQNSFTFGGMYGVMTISPTLDSMRARDYAPALGRFVSVDPDRQDTNLYQYAGNSPVANTDPSGRWYVDIGISGGVGIGGTVGVQIGSGGVYPYVGVGVTTPGVGASAQVGPGEPSPGFGGQVQGAYGPGVVGVAGTVSGSSGGISGSLGVGVGIGGSKVTGIGAYGTYTFGPFFRPPPPPPPPIPPVPEDL
jgi:RHS repeat-associated protein